MNNYGLVDNSNKRRGIILLIKYAENLEGFSNIKYLIKYFVKKNWLN